MQNIGEEVRRKVTNEKSERKKEDTEFMEVLAYTNCPNCGTRYAASNGHCPNCGYEPKGK